MSGLGCLTGSARVPSAGLVRLGWVCLSAVVCCLAIRLLSVCWVGLGSSVWANCPSGLSGLHNSTMGQSGWAGLGWAGLGSRLSPPIRPSLANWVRHWAGLGCQEPLLAGFSLGLGCLSACLGLPVCCLLGLCLSTCHCQGLLACLRLLHWVCLSTMGWAGLGLGCLLLGWANVYPSARCLGLLLGWAVYLPLLRLSGLSVCLPGLSACLPHLFLPAVWVRWVCLLLGLPLAGLSGLPATVIVQQG